MELPPSEGTGQPPHAEPPPPPDDTGNPMSREASPPLGISGHPPSHLAATPPRGGKKVRTLMGAFDATSGVNTHTQNQQSVPQSQPPPVEERRRKISFKEATMGDPETNPRSSDSQYFNFNPEDVVSSDSEGEDDEDPICPTIRLSKEEKTLMRKPWWQTLIIKVLDYKVSYLYLKRRLAQMWSLPVDFYMIDLGYDFYLVKPGSKEEYNRILTGGPWMIADRYVTVLRWVPKFDPRTSGITKVVAWVRVPNLCMEFYHPNFLLNLAKRIGRPIRIDTTTEECQRGSFARVCVEIDLTKPLLSLFRSCGLILRMQYEGLHQVCYECGRYGHNQDGCSFKGTNEPKQSEQPRQPESDTGHSKPEMQTTRDSPFGEWMVFNKKYRGRKAQPTGRTTDFSDSKTVRNETGKAKREARGPGRDKSSVVLTKSVADTKESEMDGIPMTASKFDALATTSEEQNQEGQIEGQVDQVELNQAKEKQNSSKELLSAGKAKIKPTNQTNSSGLRSFEATKNRPHLTKQAERTTGLPSKQLKQKSTGGTPSSGTKPIHKKTAEYYRIHTTPSVKDQEHRQGKLHTVSQQPGQSNIIAASPSLYSPVHGGQRMELGRLWAKPGEEPTFEIDDPGDTIMNSTEPDLSTPISKMATTDDTVMSADENEDIEIHPSVERVVETQLSS